ncbi:MAG: hypothetical protein U5K00_18280 [Melioribacteraceae bacterium]|nr:hypothetical protein [Melioribacteraceae bacterium]
MQTQNNLEVKKDKTTDLSFLFMVSLLGIGFLVAIVFMIYSLFE